LLTRVALVRSLRFDKPAGQHFGRCPKGEHPYHDFVTQVTKTGGWHTLPPEMVNCHAKQAFELNKNPEIPVQIERQTPIYNVITVENEILRKN
jgi:hypothetical protein